MNRVKMRVVSASLVLPLFLVFVFGGIGLHQRFYIVQAILISTLFLQTGIWVRNIAVLLYVKKMTNDDTFAVSLISVAEFAPIFVFSFIGRTFADRWRPKRTMAWCDLLSAASTWGCSSSAASCFHA
jgi:Na+/melibiose symporter-like transporter